MTTPRLQDALEELRTWARAATSALETMLEDLKAERFTDDTLEKDFRFCYDLMVRRRVLAENLRLQRGSQRGPDLTGQAEGGDGNVAE